MSLTPENRLEYWLKEIKEASGGSSLPDITPTVDNGKVLGIANNEWGKVADKGTPFEITLTNSGSAWTADKTLFEILDAIEAGYNPYVVGAFTGASAVSIRATLSNLFTANTGGGGVIVGLTFMGTYSNETYTNLGDVYLVNCLGGTWNVVKKTIGRGSVHSGATLSTEISSVLTSFMTNAITEMTVSSTKHYNGQYNKIVYGGTDEAVALHDFITNIYSYGGSCEVIFDGLPVPAMNVVLFGQEFTGFFLGGFMDVSNVSYLLNIAVMMKTTGSGNYGLIACMGDVYDPR